MNNIPELLKTTKLKKYSKGEKMKLLRTSLKMRGRDIILMMCMEEISELIEVISNNISNGVNYIHTAEEIVDVHIMIEYIKIICKVKQSDLSKIKIDRKKQSRSIVISSIKTLSKCNQLISKIGRRKEGANDKAALLISNIESTLRELKRIFKIRKKDIEKIELLKYHRLEKRIENKSVI